MAEWNKKLFNRILQRGAPLMAAASFLLPSAAAAQEVKHPVSIEYVQRVEKSASSFLDTAINAYEADQMQFAYQGKQIPTEPVMNALSQIMGNRPDLMIGEKTSQDLNLMPARSIEYQVVGKPDSETGMKKSEVVDEFLQTAGMAAAHGKTAFIYDNLIYQMKDGGEQFAAFLTARENFQSSFDFKGQTYSTLSALSGVDQLNRYGNINEEITSPQHALTKLMTRNTVRQWVREDLQNEQFNKMVRQRTEIEKGVENGVISDDKADAMYERIDQETRNFSALKSPSYRSRLADRLKRTYEVMEASNYPEIYPKAFYNDLIGMIASIGGPGASHFSPNLFTPGGDMFLTDARPEFFVAELSHAFRQHNNRLGEGYQFFRDGIVDLATFNSFGFTPDAHSENYETPGRMEFDTHKVVEPVLYAYISGKEVDTSLFKGKLETLPEAFAVIDMRRKEIDATYWLTSKAQEITDEGYKQITRSASYTVNSEVKDYPNCVAEVIKARQVSER